MRRYAYHPVCLAFPEYAPDVYRQRLEAYRERPELAGDTKVILAVDEADGELKVADGRHHERICAELGYTVEYEVFEGSRPQLVAFIKARNAHRRHDTPSQIAASVVMLHEWERGGDRGNQHTGGKASRDALPTQKQAADDAGVSRETIQRAAKVAKQAPDVLPAVRDGKLDAYTAAKVADLPPDQRAEIVASPDPKAAAKAALTPPADDIGETLPLFGQDADSEPVIQGDDDTADNSTQDQSEQRHPTHQYMPPRKGKPPPPRPEYPEPLGSILDDLTALAGKITRFLNSDIPEAVKIKEYVGVCKLGWVNYTRAKIVVTGGVPRKTNPNWRAFQAVRALFRQGYRDRNLKKPRAEQFLRDLMNEEGGDTLEVRDDGQTEE